MPDRRPRAGVDRGKVLRSTRTCRYRVLLSTLLAASSALATGQKLSFAGENFQTGGSLSAPAMQELSIKIDALSPTEPGYTGTAATGGVVGKAQLQADGTVSGSLVIPADIETANTNTTGPHFLRILGGNPGTSCWSETFSIGANASQPTASATSAIASSRGNTTHTLTVTGSGFAANEPVRISSALSSTDYLWTVGTGNSATTQPTINADASGNLSGRVALAAGVLNSGERQLIVTGDTSQDPATAQATVNPLVTVSGTNLGSQGTVSVVNATPGTVFSRR